MIRALTFDFWDTLYVAARVPARAMSGSGDAGRIDNELMMLPPAMFAGAWKVLRELDRHFTLAVVSDNTLASGRALERLLEKDGVRSFFSHSIHPENVPGEVTLMSAAHNALEVEASEIVHIGDSERTDVRAALAAGFRAIRLDVAHDGGPSEAEFVARTFAELGEYLLSTRA